MRTIYLSFVIGLVVLAAALLGGCGPIMAPFKDASVQVNAPEIAEPLQVSKERARSVKKIVVVNGNPTKSISDKKMITIGLSELRAELQKTKRFVIIAPRITRRTASKMQLLQDLAAMTEGEIYEEAARLAEALGAHAALVVRSHSEKMSMGSAMASTLFKGTVSAPLTVSLDMVSFRTAESMYHQELPTQLTVGSMGLSNTTDAEIRAMMTPIMKPLAIDLVRSFT